MKPFQDWTKDQILRELKKERARRSFWHFCLMMNEGFFIQRPFIERIAEGFQMVADGQIKSLHVSVPPRAGKSYTTSLFAAWMLGRNPSGSIMRNCCTATLYEKFSYDTRDIIRSQTYQEIFPDARLSPDKQNLRGWNLTEAVQVSYFGDGVGGTIIGFGATLAAITDDLFRSYDDALSEKVLDKTHSWYAGTHKSRMESGCPIIDIGTRWSKRDIIGYNVEEGRYEHSIVIPALDEQDKSFCENVKTTAEYIQLRNDTPPEIWNAEYMQNPSDVAGSLFKRDDIQRYNPSELKQEGCVATLAYIDVADEGTDSTAGLVAKVYNQRVYITGCIFTKDNIDITAPRVVDLIKHHNIDMTRIEANNQGGGFIREIRRHIAPDKVVGVKNTANKHTRILMKYGFIKRHVFFPNDIEPGSEMDRFLREVFNYVKAGSTTDDDAPDTLSGLCNFVERMCIDCFEPNNKE